MPLKTSSAKISAILFRPQYVKQDHTIATPGNNMWDNSPLQIQYKQIHMGKFRFSSGYFEARQTVEDSQ